MARPRRNNANYFTHDTGMRKDGRITVLRSKFGLEGYALYCMTLEYLTDSENFTAALDEVELQIIAADFGVTPERLIEVWSEAARLRLLEFSGSKIYCSKLVDRLQPLLDERERQRMKAQRRWERDGNTELKESFTTVKPRYNNAGDMQSKGEERKEEKTKENEKEIVKKNYRFSPPSLLEIESYFKQKVKETKSSLNPETEAVKFEAHYGSKNWFVGKNKMTDWKKAISGWIARSNSNESNNNTKRESYSVEDLYPPI